MPLTQHTREQIRSYLLAELRRYVKEQKASSDNYDVKPFHARLLPPLFSVSLSERSFSTRSGSWWQNIGRFVARQYHVQAENGYQLEGQIKPAAASHIEEIINQLNTPGARKPNRDTDVSEVQVVQSPRGDAIRVRADLFIRRHDGGRMYFEIKTPMPNKDTSIAMKKFVLKVAAIEKGNAAEAFAATAYNPFGRAAEYNWNYACQFLEIGADMLIGENFWNYIGDGSTYDELLDISEDVGKEVERTIFSES